MAKLGHKVVEAANNGKAYLPLMDPPDRLPDGSATDMIDDLRRVQEENPDKYISRRFYLQNGNYSRRAWSARFGTFEEFRRQAGLDLNRGAHRVELHTGLHASRDIYRGFKETEIDPYVGKHEKPMVATGIKRMLIGSDFHGKDVDPFAMTVFLDVAKSVQPDHIVLAGDVYDLYDFSRFDKDPRKLDLGEELKFVRDCIFKPLRETCPNAQIDLIAGNHEMRFLRHLADRTPYMKVFLDVMGFSMNRLFGLDEYQINFISRYDLAAHKTAEVRSEMAKNYKTYYGLYTVIHDAPKGNGFKLCGANGHGHKPGVVFDVDERFGCRHWTSLGCMSKVDAEYVEGLNKYQQGFALVTIDCDIGAVHSEYISFSDRMAVALGKVYHREAK